MTDEQKAMTDEQKAIMAWWAFYWEQLRCSSPRDGGDGEMIEEFNRQEHAIECKRFAEKTIREAIQSFEQETGLKVDGIDYSRPMQFADPRLPSHVFVTIRAMLP